MKKNLIKLCKGAELLLINDSNSAAATMLYLFKTGSRQEDNKYSGLAHFVEHVIFKGSKHYPSAYAITSKIESLGASMNAFTSYEHTGFYIKAPKDVISEANKVFMDIIFFPVFPSGAIELEKKVIIEEIKMYNDMPAYRVQDLFQSSLYGNNGLGKNITGSEKTVSGINRELCKKYVDAYFYPDNLLVIASGNTNKALIVSDLNKVLGNINSSCKASNIQIQQRESVYNSVYSMDMDIDQVHIVLGSYFYSEREVEDSREEVILGNAILSGGMGSLLFRKLREEKGLAYYVDSNTASYSSIGDFRISIGIDASNIKMVLKELFKQLDIFINMKIPDTDMNRAKNYIIGKLITEYETSEDLSAWYGMQQLINYKVKSIAEVIERIKKITKKDLVRVWKKKLGMDNFMACLVGRDIKKLIGKKNIMDFR